MPVRKRWAMTRPDPGRFLLGAVLEDSAGRRQSFRPALSSLPACFRAYATRLWRVHLHGLPQRSLARAASRYSWTTLQPLPVARRRGRRDRRVLLTARGVAADIRSWRHRSGRGVGGLRFHCSSLSTVLSSCRGSRASDSRSSPCMLAGGVGAREMVIELMTGGVLS